MDELSAKKDTVKEAKEYAGLTVEEKLAKLENEKAELERKLREQDENTGIPLDAYIEVMSLVPYKLNLSTEKLGQGRQFSFSKFGEIKRILYNDLASIFENYRSFMEMGFFYILNPKVIRKHGLDDVYEHILNKEMIEKVLNFDSKSAVKLYESASSSQQEVIDGMLITKIKNNDAKDIDFNIIAQITKIGGRDIAKIAQETKDLEAGDIPQTR
jgi:hypothetical protein